MPEAATAQSCAASPRTLHSSSVLPPALATNTAHVTGKSQDGCPVSILRQKGREFENDALSPPSVLANKLTRSRLGGKSPSAAFVMPGGCGGKTTISIICPISSAQIADRLFQEYEATPPIHIFNRTAVDIAPLAPTGVRSDVGTTAMRCVARTAAPANTHSGPVISR